MQEFRVDLGERSYPILIGQNFLGDAALWNTHCAAKVVAIVTNTTVHPLYGEKLRATLLAAGKHVVEIILPDGEAYKNFETLNLIYSGLLQARCDRKTMIIALGGGVVGDMAGFAAATYQRGIPFIQVPTTLLSQVDSSVGGKTGINHPLGKNMIGAFYQPNAVFTDVSTLATLPERELSAGLAEIIKHGAIADPELFVWLEANMAQLRACKVDALTHAILRSCQIKARVVEADEREGGLRAILNFGHTFGHAIESGLGYGAWLHGEAVGAGMVQAAELSWRLGMIDSDLKARLTCLVDTAGLPVVAPDFGAERWDELIAVDKKNDAGSTRYILLESLGKASIARVPQDVLHATLSATATLPLKSLLSH